MRKFQRASAPTFLLSNWEEWSSNFERLSKTSSARFRWPDLEGKPVNHKLLPHLKQQVQSHCSFCDQFPVSPPGTDTIEHFRPKAQFPGEAFKWENLYFCCNFCQVKSGKFKEIILRPDSTDYDFDGYFFYDFTTGTLHPKTAASLEDQLRAQTTIEYFRLNTEHPQWRRRELYRRQRHPAEPIDDFAYRDFVEPPGLLSVKSME